MMFLEIVKGDEGFRSILSKIFRRVLWKDIVSLRFCIVVKLRVRNLKLVVSNLKESLI